ncbi:MAG TPA: FmdB family zinc ribbon protein [Phycisphaerae bacterium]|jgi:putative FmdB family regulatory protein
MPTYEYECSACGNRFEEFQSITAKPIKKCPKCGKLKVKRLISAGAGFIFKGSGFYITDYRSDNYKESAKGDAPKTDSAPAKTDGKSDSPAKTESPKTDAAPATAAKTESKPAAPAPKAESKASSSSAKKSGK